MLEQKRRGLQSSAHPITVEMLDMNENQVEIKSTFLKLMARYSEDTEYNSYCWEIIYSQYSHGSRYYHNLNHLQGMIAELKTVETLIDDLDSMLFSIFYHDVIYDPQRGDNEEASADLLVQHLQRTTFPTISKSVRQITCTKTHSYVGDVDTDTFVDIDLSILGKSWKVYNEYAQNIRREYSMYPDEMYSMGRAKVLRSIIGKDWIYGTNIFREKYEQVARENMEQELRGLEAG